MNRLELQTLALSRLEDAKSLLANGRWTAAYYLAGYTVECGLKSCLLKHIGDTGFIFKDRDKLTEVGKKYWTHDLESLVNMAGLKVALGTAQGANPVLAAYWLTTKNWTETCRYEAKGEVQARQLIEAIDDTENGVLQWLQQHW